jgi:hypothetical protein
MFELNMASFVKYDLMLFLIQLNFRGAIAFLLIEIFQNL